MRPTQGRLGSIQPTVATPIQPVGAMDTQPMEPTAIPTATAVTWSSGAAGEAATMAVGIMAVATRAAIGAVAIEVEIRRAAIQRDIRKAAIDRRAREAAVIER